MQKTAGLQVSSACMAYSSLNLFFLSNYLLLSLADVPSVWTAIYLGVKWFCYYYFHNSAYMQYVSYVCVMLIDGYGPTSSLLTLLQHARFLILMVNMWK